MLTHVFNRLVIEPSVNLYFFCVLKEGLGDATLLGCIARGNVPKMWMVGTISIVHPTSTGT